VANADQPIEITVTLRECNGNVIVGAQVQFGQQSGPSGPSAGGPQAAPAQALNGQSIQLMSAVQLTSAAGCQASFSPPTAVTDANGVARSTVTLPPGCPCQYVLTATGAGLTLTTTVREQGCLPFTTGARAVVPAGPTIPTGPALVVAGLALLAASGTYLRVRRRS
jgi:hypothetical protein